MGLERVLDIFGREGDLANKTILDAGCGTGQFAELLAGHVKQVEGIDTSSEMLVAARNRLGRLKNARLAEASIEQLPFEDDTFDGVVLNQVLHHLDDADPWPKHQQVFGELRRVCKPGASVVINTCSHEQVRLGYWYVRLLPERIPEAMCAKYCPLDTVLSRLKEAGFETAEATPVIDELLMGIRYFEKRGPMNAQWRHGDSTFSLLTPEELQQYVELIARKNEENPVEGWIAELDHSRASVGQFTLVEAR